VKILPPLLVALFLAVAPAAEAACAPMQPARFLRAADAAFVGRLIEQRDDGFLIFAVDERIKGDLGDRVEVISPFNSIQLHPPIDGQIGVFLRRGSHGAFETNHCSVTSPDMMRAGARNPGARCRYPRIASVRFRRPGRVDVDLRGVDDTATSVTVDWGDGTERSAKARRHGTRATATLRHRYRRPGAYRVTVTAASSPAPECGSRLERAGPRILRVNA